MIEGKYLIIHSSLNEKRMTCEITWDLQKEFRQIIPDTVEEEVDEGVCTCESDSDSDYCGFYDNSHITRDIAPVEDTNNHCCECGCHSLEESHSFEDSNDISRNGLTFFDTLEIPLVVNFNVEESYCDLSFDLDKQHFKQNIIRASSSETIAIQFEPDSSGININTSDSSLDESDSSGSYVDLSGLTFCSRIWPTITSLHNIDNETYSPQARTLTMDLSPNRTMDLSPNRTMDLSPNSDYLPTFRITPPEALFMTEGSILSSPYQCPKLSTVEESASEMDECDSRSLLETSVSSDPFADVHHQNALQIHTQNSCVYNIRESPLNSQSPSCDTSPQTSPTYRHCSRESDDSSVSSASPGRRRRRRHGTSIDIEEVKELTSRLNLNTRRPSVHAWQQAHFCGSTPKFIHSKSQDISKEEVGPDWSHDFRDRINSSLDWLTSELTAMREQDAILARQLLNIRKDMYKLKLQRSVQSHQMILEEAIEMEEERDEYHQSRECDLLPDLFSPTLKQLGVTRMNLSVRRFSVF